MPRSLYKCGPEGKLVHAIVPVRTLGPGYVRVTPLAVAFNPTDYKHLVNKLAVGAGAGCDFAGIVTEVGPEVRGISVGDTVAGGQTGSNLSRPLDGVYSTVVDVRADSVFKFARNLVVNGSTSIKSGAIASFEQASSLGVSLGTIALASCWYNKKPLKRNTVSGFALVYGAASSLGFYACQIFQWMGYEVIAVASPKHADLFESIGIKHLVDYHDPEWPQLARKIGSIEYAYDTISVGSTIGKVYEAMDRGKINTSLPIHPKKMPTGKDIVVDTPLWYLLWNKSWPMGPWFKENVASEELLAQTPNIFYQVNALLAEGWLKALPISVYGSGFDKIPSGILEFGKGVSATKMVVRLGDRNKL